MKDLQGLEIRKDSIRISFMYKRVRCRETLSGPAWDPSKKTAINAAIKLRAAILHEISNNTFDYGKHFPDSKVAQKHGWITYEEGENFGEGMRAFLDAHKRRVSAKSAERYEKHTRNHVLPRFEDYDVADITAKMINEWMDELFAAEYSKHTIINIMTPMRIYLDKCVTDEIIAKTPFANVSYPSTETTEAKPLSRAELDRVIGSVKEHHIRVVFQFLAATGIRPDELYNLKWKDVTLTSSEQYPLGSIYIAKSKTKSGIRRVRLFQPAVDALKFQRKVTFFQGPDALVFQTLRGKSWANNNSRLLRVAWHDALDECGLENRRMYELRHTYASMLLTVGEPVAWVSRQLGHKNALVTLEVYARWISDDAMHVGDRAAAFLAKPPPREEAQTA